MLETVKPTEEVALDRGGLSPPPISGSRLRIAQVLAFVGLVAALVGALGPADKIGTVYSWPLATLPEGTPNRVWYTPLLLTRRAPESIAASLPCSVVPALPKAGSPTTVLATARYPEIGDGLSVTSRDTRLTVTVGDDMVARVPLATSPAADDSCAYRLDISNRRWSINGGPNAVHHEGGLESMPVVNGLFSGVRMRPGLPPSVSITTLPHQTRPLFRQKLAWVIAALAIAAALLLMVVERWPSSLPSKAKRRAHGALRHGRPEDLVVAATLIGWWLMAPAHWDDGWVMARQSGFSTSRGFSNYYDAFAVNFPNGYWLEWAQHWLTQASSSLVLLRLPALLCLAATWLLCRWIVSRVLPLSARADRVVVAALVSGFLAGALAWGMTLRPEPVSALLVTAAMACAVRFLERESVAPLAVLGILIPLAITAHHSGVLAMASLLVIAPQLLAWARRNAAAAATVVTTAVALTVVLAFVGADIGQRSADAYAFRAYGITDAWYDEFRRYAYLSDENGGTPLRRGSVALLLLVVLGFVLRRGRERRVLADLPAATVAVSLVMLIIVPSKWPWHFGTLLGVVAVAAATETARFRDDSAHSRGWHVRPSLALAALTLAIAWSWGSRERWTIIDLRELEWRLGFEQQLSVTTLAVALPLLLLLFLVVQRRAMKSQDRAPWITAGAAAPLLIVPAIVFTVVVLAADTLKADSWTLARQNVEAVRGKAGCGVADNILIPASDSMRGVSTFGRPRERAAPNWVPRAPIDVRRYALDPLGEGNASSSPWFRLPRDSRIGLFVAGQWTGSDSLSVEWARLRERDAPEFLDADLIERDVRSSMAGVSPWRFVRFEDLDDHGSDADGVRITFRSNAQPAAAVAVTAPVTYANEAFTHRLNPSARVLVGPGLRPYFPCANLPTLRGGTVETPQYVVSPANTVFPLTYPTSPFVGLLDVYQMDRISPATQSDALNQVAIYEVDDRIPGGIQAPALRRDVVR